MNSVRVLENPFFILAPMDDVTDTVFRQVITSLAKPDMFFTEFVNVDGLQSPGRQKLLKKLRFTQTDTPLVAQLWGKNPDNFRKTAEQIADGSLAAELGLRDGVNYAGVDLNMGCPQKKEVNGGTCSALINDRPLAEEIIDATRSGIGGKLPLSVKTRLGYNEVDLSWPEFLLNKRINMLTMHGRTRKQMSKVPADWELIGKVREIRDRIAPETLIVGNGDVRNKRHGLELAMKYKLDGIMIGRGIFHDPFAFAPASDWEDMPASAKLGLYKKHIELFLATWRAGDRPIHTLNKFCKIYINGFDGAKELREKLMSANDGWELLDILGQAAEAYFGAELI